MVDGAFRCSIRSEDLDEPVFATASHVRNWLLIEHDGPWGPQAFSDARGLGEVGPALVARTRAHRVRPILIRRVGRAGDAPLTIFAIHSGPHDPWIERLSVPRIEDALGLDTESLGRGASVGGASLSDPLFLVCTHGRHDPCCAERGRPLAAAMNDALPGATWECSHIGGDRFAANLLAFPHGLYFGRVDPADGPAIARRYADGRIDLDRYRGRSCHAMVAQAAEQFVRRDRSLDGVDDVSVRSVETAADDVVVTLGTADGNLRVRLAVGPAAERSLTCHSERALAPPTYRLLDIAPISGGAPGP